MNNLELLSIGDATMDAYISPTESEALCELNSKDCLICFSYGDKIPVKKLDFSVGGNAANNAVGTRRLGVNSAYVGTLGDDSTGKIIAEKLREEGVDISLMDIEPNSSSNYSTVINYSGERTIFTYHAQRNYKFPSSLPYAPWVYLTSMGEGFEEYYSKLIDWLSANEGAKLAFNPGSRQIRAEQDILKPILQKTYLIYVNREEAEKISGFANSDGKEKDLLNALAETGPKMCIITDGGNGSYVFDGQNYLRAGVLPVDAFERTGAGDSFGSGCLAGIIKGKPLEEALIWGASNAASVIGFIGPQKGLLHDSEMPIWVDRAKSSQVEVVKL